MVGGVSGGAGFDPTKGFDKIPDAIKDMDLKKQVRKTKAQPTDESIIDGVTHDSIAEFVASQKSPGSAPINSDVGFFARLRKRFSR